MMHHLLSPVMLPISLLPLLSLLGLQTPQASALEDTLRAIPTPPNQILYEGYYPSLANLGSVRVVSNVPVNYQRYHDDQFFVGQAPLSRNEAKVVVSSDCSTSETNVVPTVSWETNDAESPLVTLTVDVPLAEERDPALMPFLDPGFYEAIWNYTSYWCVVFGSYQPTTDPTPAPGGTVEEVPCMTREECDVRRQELGFSSFYVDASYPSKGCFSKNDKAFFGLGGTDEEMGKADLPGLQERIWCERSVEAIPELEGFPTSSPPATGGGGDEESVCLTEEECNARRKELGFKSFYVDASYPSKGCFSKNDKAFFGEGGTVEQMSDPGLAGLQQRIWCRGGAVPAPSTKSQSQNSVLGNGDGSTIMSYPEASVSLIEKAEEETAGTTLNTSASMSPGNAVRFSISMRLVMVTFMVIWMLSILCSELRITSNLTHFGGFGKYVVTALVVSAAVIYPQDKNERKTSASFHHFDQQTRSLQPSCTYNVDILMDGCRSVEIISQAPARVVNVSFLNYTEQLNEEDDCTTEYSANLTFPITPDTEELQFTPEGLARVASYPEEMCIQIAEGRPFVDDSGIALKAAAIVFGDDSWSSWDGENDRMSDEEENQCGEDSKNNATNDHNYLRLGEEWTQRALSEHSSIASFSAFSIALMTNNAPSSLVEDALKAGLDEIRHAKVSFRIATSLLSKATSTNHVGDKEIYLGPGPLPPSSLSFTQNLTELALSVAKEGCIDETLSALMAAAEAEIIRRVLQNRTDHDGGTTHDGKYSGIEDATLAWMQRELQTIAGEESNHSALAWRTLKWVCDTDEEACHTVLRDVLEVNKLDAAFSFRFATLLSGEGDLYELGIMLEREWKILYNIQKNFVFRDFFESDGSRSNVDIVVGGDVGTGGELLHSCFSKTILSGQLSC